MIDEDTVEKIGLLKNKVDKYLVLAASPTTPIKVILGGLIQGLQEISEELEAIYLANIIKK